MHVENVDAAVHADEEIETYANRGQGRGMHEGLNLRLSVTVSSNDYPGRVPG